MFASTSVLLHAGLDDVRVDLCDAVDGVGAHDAEVRHVDPLPPLLLDQRHPAEAVHVIRELGGDVLRGRRRGGGRQRETEGDERR